MTNKYYQNTKKNSKKKHTQDIKIFLKKKKFLKGKKRFKKKKKVKKSVTIIVNLIKIYLRNKSKS